MGGGCGKVDKGRTAIYHQLTDEVKLQTRTNIDLAIAPAIEARAPPARVGLVLGGPSRQYHAS